MSFYDHGTIDSTNIRDYLKCDCDTIEGTPSQFIAWLSQFGENDIIKFYGGSAEGCDNIEVGVNYKTVYVEY